MDCLEENENKKEREKLKMIQFPCKDKSKYIKYLQIPRIMTTSRETTRHRDIVTSDKNICFTLIELFLDFEKLTQLSSIFILQFLS